MSDWTSGGTRLSGPGMTPRFARRTNKRRNRRAKPRTRVDKKLSRRISKLENQQERKYYDTAISDPPTTTGDAFSLIGGIDDGDDYNQRDGNQVTAKRLLFKYRLVYPAAAGAYLQYRIIVFWDKQCNAGNSFQLFTGTTPTDEELSSSLLDNRAAMVSVNSNYNQNTRDRYKILYDRTHTISKNASDVDMAVNIKKSISLSGAKVKWSSSSTGLGSLPGRNLVVAFFYSGALAAPAHNITSRFFFTDD